MVDLQYENGPEKWLHRKNRNVAVYNNAFQMLLKHFLAWQKYAKTNAVVNRRFKVKSKFHLSFFLFVFVTENVILGDIFMRGILEAFRHRVAWERKLKLKVIDKWVRSKELQMRYAFQYVLFLILHVLLLADTI